jgi:hypothetical protein
MSVKIKQMKNKKRVFKNDIGNKVKVKALDDMGVSNSTFDHLNDEFINKALIDYNSPVNFLDLYDENN